MRTFNVGVGNDISCLKKISMLSQLVAMAYADRRSSKWQRRRANLMQENSKNACWRTQYRAFDLAFASI